MTIAMTPTAWNDAAWKLRKDSSAAAEKDAVKDGVAKDSSARTIYISKMKAEPSARRAKWAWVNVLGVISSGGFWANPSENSNKTVF